MKALSRHYRSDFSKENFKAAATSIAYEPGFFDRMSVSKVKFL
jgi:hypothetical protein